MTSHRSTRPAWLVLLSLAAALALSGPADANAAGPGAGARAAKACPGFLVSRGGLPIDEISASGMSCKQARKVLKGATINGNPGVPGWRCKSLKTRRGGGNFSCVKGSRTVRFGLRM